MSASNLFRLTIFLAVVLAVASRTGSASLQKLLRIPDRYFRIWRPLFLSIATAWLFTIFMLVTGGISETLDGFLIDGALFTTAGLVATIFCGFLARFLPK